MPQGRKRLMVPREANGRPQRPSVAKMAEIERAKRMENTITVLNQPHRRGDADPRRVSALGRFCQRMKCKRELLDAATDYLNYRRWWGNAMGKPRGFENTSPRAGGGEGPSDATVRGWLEAYLAVDMMIQRGAMGQILFPRFHRMVVDDIDPPADPAADLALVDVLVKVAVHMGRMSARQSAFD